MNLLFIQSFLDSNYDVFIHKCELVAFLWILILIAITIDFISGILKSIKAGKKRSSTGFRRTVTKAIQYYSLMSFAFIFDILISAWFNIPYVSILGSIFVVFTEGKSVFERFDEKERNRLLSNAEILIELLEEKDKILDKIKELSDKNKENEQV